MHNDFEQTLKSVMDTIVNDAKEKAKKTDSHEELFKAYKHSGLEGMLRKCEHLMIEHAFNIADIIREELGREITRDEWNILQGLPLVINQMKREIEKNEGIGCCVDKTYQRLAKTFLK